MKQEKFEMQEVNKIVETFKSQISTWCMLGQTIFSLEDLQIEFMKAIDCVLFDVYGEV